MSVAQITPLILTYDEEPNIARVLDRLHWAGRIVVVDSFSKDRTEALCRQNPRVVFLQRPFDSLKNQWNFGLEAVETDWALSLDADYVLSEALVEELQRWSPAEDVDAYFTSFDYAVLGKLLRRSLYPPREVLFRRSKCRFEQDGHQQRLSIPGKTGYLKGKIIHDDRKSLSHWLWAQDRYATLEIAKMANRPKGERTPFKDRLRRMIVPAPPLVFLYTLFGKGLILDGWRGWYYAVQRALAESIVSLRLLEAKFSTRDAQDPPCVA